MRPFIGRRNFLEVAGVAVASLPCAASGAVPAPDELMRRSIAAVRRNAELAKNYLYREDIVFRDLAPSGRAVRTATRRAEVIFVEGAPFYRVVSRNGHPLDGEDARREQQRMEEEAAWRRAHPGESRPIVPGVTRFSVAYELLPRNHVIRIEGETPFGGRPVWVLKAIPKRGPRPGNDAELYAKDMLVTIWVDKATLHHVRMFCQARKKVLGLPKGHTIDYNFRLVDNSVWLAERFVLTIPLQHGAVVRRETIQQYSDYRRFQAESTVESVAP